MNIKKYIYQSTVFFAFLFLFSAVPFAMGESAENIIVDPDFQSKLKECQTKKDFFEIIDLIDFEKLDDEQNEQNKLKEFIEEFKNSFSHNYKAYIKLYKKLESNDTSKELLEELLLSPILPVGSNERVDLAFKFLEAEEFSAAQFILKKIDTKSLSHRGGYNSLKKQLKRYGYV